MKTNITGFAVLICVLLCGCGRQNPGEPQKPAEIPKAALPQTYGIYALVNSQYQQLNPSAASAPTLPATAEFLVFDRSLTIGLGDLERIVQLQERKYVRKEVEHTKIDQDQPATGLEVREAGYFLPTTAKLPLRFGPVENRQDMLKVIPVSAMQRGLYYLKIGNEDYSFSVNISEQEGKNTFVVDKHITTVNGAVSTDYMDVGALDLAIQELKHKAQSSLQNNQLKNGLEYARNYLRFDPQDDSFTQEIRSKLVALYEAAANRQLWGCAILLAREANTLQLIGGKNMEQLANEKLAEWNKEQADSEKYRLQQAKTPTNTLWIQGSLEMTIGNNLVYRGTDTRVTEIGIQAVRGERESVNIWFGNDYGFQKEGTQDSPAVKFYSGTGYDQVGFFFPPGPERDNMFNACCKALTEFRENIKLARWSCEVTDRKTVVWTLTCDADNTFSTSVNLPTDWKVVSMDGPKAIIVNYSNSQKKDTYLLGNNAYSLGAIKDIYPWSTPKYQNNSANTPFAPSSEPMQILCDYRMYPDLNTANSGRMGWVPLTIEMSMP